MPPVWQAGLPGQKGKIASSLTTGRPLARLQTPWRAPARGSDGEAVAWRQRLQASKPSRKLAAQAAVHWLSKLSNEQIYQLACYSVRDGLALACGRSARATYHTQHPLHGRRLSLMVMRLHEQEASGCMRANRVQLAAQAAVHCPGRAWTDASSPATRSARRFGLQSLRSCNLPYASPAVAACP